MGDKVVDEVVDEVEVRVMSIRRCRTWAERVAKRKWILQLLAPAAPTVSYTKAINTSTSTHIYSLAHRTTVHSAEFRMTKTIRREIGRAHV